MSKTPLDPGLVGHRVTWTHTGERGETLLAGAVVALLPRGQPADPHMVNPAPYTFSTVNTRIDRYLVLASLTPEGRNRYHCPPSTDVHKGLQQ